MMRADTHNGGNGIALDSLPAVQARMIDGRIQG
jgi:hypothetical protein